MTDVIEDPGHGPGCHTCRYWRENMGSDGQNHGWDGMGLCRRHAPRPVVVDGIGENQPGRLSAEEVGDGFTAWPITFGNDWCGEHSTAR